MHLLCPRAMVWYLCASMRRPASVTVLYSTVCAVLFVSPTPHTQAQVKKVAERLAYVQNARAQQRKYKHMLSRDCGDAKHEGLSRTPCSTMGRLQVYVNIKGSVSVSCS